MENHNIHTCIECGSAVTDLVSIKVENDNVIRLGKQLNGNWICDDCSLKQKGVKSETIDYSKEVSPQSSEITSSKDVSPNTPPA